MKLRITPYRLKVCSIYYSCVEETISLKLLCRYSPVFSNSVFGVLSLLIMSISSGRINGIYALVSDPMKKEMKYIVRKSYSIYRSNLITILLAKSLPSFMAISPIAHVALLHTDIN